MPLYCPDCKNEILPYLKTGEYKEAVGDVLKTFQLYFCIHCKTVFWKDHDAFKFKPLETEEKETNETTSSNTND